MLGSPAAWFYSHLGGLQLPTYPNATGWRYFHVQPTVLERLGSASVSLMTPAGRVGSEWSVNCSGDSYFVSATVPTGSTARVRIDTSVCGSGVTSITESYQTVWNQAGFHAGVVAGVQAGWADEGHVYLLIASGSYAFQIIL
jgi:hypothetical protein